MPIQKHQVAVSSVSLTSGSSSSEEELASSRPRPPPPASGKKATAEMPKSKPKPKSEPIPSPGLPQVPFEADATDEDLDSADGGKPLDGEESVSEFESGSDTDSSPEKPETRKSARIVKPIISKPMDETPKPKNLVTVTKPALTSPSKSTASKRPSEPNKDGKELKKKKKKEKSADADEDEEDASKKSVEDPKKQLFQRLWSEDDEIVILKGLVEFVNKATDKSDFYEYIKKSLHVEVNKSQLLDKIRRLKKKYENNVKKGEKSGKDPSFAKPHEQTAYELSKKVWGGRTAKVVEGEDKEANDYVGGNNSVVAKNRVKGNDTVLASPRSKAVTPKDNQMDKGGDLQNGFLYSCLDESKLNFGGNLNLFGWSESILKKGLDLIESSKAKELEEKWKKLQMAEMEVYLKRVDLVREQMKLVLEALKSSSS